MNSKIHLTTLFATLFLMLISSGCIVHKLNLSRSEGAFNGISELLKGGKDLTIFTTHGMGISGVNYADDLVNHLTGKAGFEFVENKYFYNTNSALKVAHYEREDQQLTLYHHGWYPATAAYRWWVLDASDVIRERLPAMAEIKTTLMNISVSDVIMYQGNFRRTIRDNMQLTIEKMLTEHPGGHYVAITESLGSKIFLDVMNESLETNAAWANDFVNSLASVYMLSNQIPLLELGDLNVRLADEGLSEISLTELKGFNESLDQKATGTGSLFQALKTFTSFGVEKAQDEKPQLIAISDPNDLLSYPIPKRAVNPDNYYLVNAYVNVARKGYSWPFKKPQIVNPLKAHLGYQNDPRVIDYIVSGTNE